MVTIEEYKIGDWVVLKEEIRKTITTTSFNTPFQIDKISSCNTYLYKKNGNNRYLKEFRKAELHEIPVEFRNILQTIEIW